MSALQTYIGTKIIQATPMKGGVYSELYGRAVAENLREEGYQVVYEDGYTSWSPKDVFERAYRPITLPENFGNLVPHQQRVVMELADLSDKINRLTLFIEGDAFDALPLRDRLDMFAQLDSMVLYQAALKRRADRFAALISHTQVAGEQVAG